MARSGMAVAGVGFIGLGALLASGWGFSSSAQHTDEVEQHLESVELDLRAGDVGIRVGEVEQATLQQDISHGWGAPDDTFMVDDGRLLLQGCGWRCTVDYELVVPEAVDVTGEVRSGNVDLTGVAGVDLDSRSGDLTAREAAGSVDVLARSGTITIDRAEPGSVRAEARSGAVEVTVPDGEYRVEGSSRSGAREIAIGTDPDAEHVLDLETRTGDVAVRHP